MLKQNVLDATIRYELARQEKVLPSLVQQSLSSLVSSFSIQFTRATVLPTTVPTEPTLFWLDRQATAQGDILYVAMQKSNGQWKWFQLIKAT